jgi:hypothetical protein
MTKKRCFLLRCMSAVVAPCCRAGIAASASAVGGKPAAPLRELVGLKVTQCMVRPCVARNFFVDLVGDGLASMYPASRWSVAPGHHGYQRACDLVSGSASTKPFGSPVFACAGKTDPPSSSQILSQTCRRESGYIIDSSPSLEQFLCSRLTSVPSVHVRGPSPPGHMPS